jgi:hypothetical protein
VENSNGAAAFCALVVGAMAGTYVGDKAATAAPPLPSPLQPRVIEQAMPKQDMASIESAVKLLACEEREPIPHPVQPVVVRWEESWK